MHFPQKNDSVSKNYTSAQFFVWFSCENFFCFSQALKIWRNFLRNENFLIEQLMIFFLRNLSNLNFMIKKKVWKINNFLFLLKQFFNLFFSRFSYSKIKCAPIFYIWNLTEKKHKQIKIIKKHHGKFVKKVTTKLKIFFWEEKSRTILKKIKVGSGKKIKNFLDHVFSLNFKHGNFDFFFWINFQFWQFKTPSPLF